MTFIRHLSISSCHVVAVAERQRETGVNLVTAALCSSYTSFLHETHYAEGWQSLSLFFLYNITFVFSVGLSRGVYISSNIASLKLFQIYAS